MGIGARIFYNYLEYIVKVALSVRKQEIELVSLVIICVCVCVCAEMCFFHSLCFACLFVCLFGFFFKINNHPRRAAKKLH